mmetsp:Transcript_17981/g.15901  ORF Transcript_17981/g.15901 Transcript_17981/m.15901 type:complete len:184 (-) Transcript_17981:1-552(-)
MRQFLPPPTIDGDFDENLEVIRDKREEYLKKIRQPYKIKRTKLDRNMLKPQLHVDNLISCPGIKKGLITSRLSKQHTKSNPFISNSDSSRSLPSLVRNVRNFTSVKKFKKTIKNTTLKEKLKKVRLYNKNFSNTRQTSIITSPGNSIFSMKNRRNLITTPKVNKMSKNSSRTYLSRIAAKKKA